MSEISKFFVTIGSKLDSKGFKAASKQISDVGKAAAIMGAVVTAAGLKVAYTAGVQERAELTLAQAMKQAGTFTKEAFEHNLEYASSLQLVTEYGDESIISVQKMLTNFGIEGEMLDKLTVGTLDLAAAKGFNLTSAADLVAKSVGSSTNALTRYGIAVTGAVGSTERAQTAVDNISKLFGGAAKASAETYLGRVKSLNNLWGDFQEKVGFEVIPVIEDLIIRTRTFILNASTWIDRNKVLVTSMASFAMKLGGVATALGGITVAVVMLIPKLQALSVAMAAHPVIALTTAFSVGTLALLEYLGASQKAADAQLNMGKTTKDLIALQQKELVNINKLLWGMEKDSEKRTELINKASQLEKNLAALKAKLAKEEIKTVKKVESTTTTWIKNHKSLNTAFLEWKKEQDGITREQWILWMEEQKVLTVEQQEFLTELRALEHQDYMTKITERMEALQAFSDGAMDVINGYYELKSQSIRNDLTEDLAAEEERYESRKTWINANIKDETKRNEMLDRLEEGHSAAQDNLRDSAERKEKAFKQKMKKFQIAEAVINTAVGATKALAQGGPFLGPALAAMMMASGMMKVAMIRAQKFASGAMAKAATLAVFGEAGPEVALPLRHPETTMALGKALALAGAGGGGDTIIVHVNRPLTSGQEARRQGHIIGTEIFREIRRNRKP